MNHGVLLEPKGNFEGIRRGYHSSRDVIVRDSSNIHPESPAGHSGSQHLSESYASNSIEHPGRRARTPDPDNESQVSVSGRHTEASERHGTSRGKPKWKAGTAMRKCWVCNSIVCSCIRPLEAPAPETARSRSRRDSHTSPQEVHGVATRAKSTRPAASTGYERTQTHQPSSIHERLYLGLSARPKERHVEPSAQNLRHATHASRQSTNSNVQHTPRALPVISTKKVRRNRLSFDDDGRAHSSSMDDEEIVSTHSQQVHREQHRSTRAAPAHPKQSQHHRDPDLWSLSTPSSSLTQSHRTMDVDRHPQQPSYVETGIGTTDVPSPLRPRVRTPSSPVSRKSTLQNMADAIDGNRDEWSPSGPRQSGSAAVPRLPLREDSPRRDSKDSRREVQVSSPHRVVVPSRFEGTVSDASAGSSGDSPTERHGKRALQPTDSRHQLLRVDSTREAVISSPVEQQQQRQQHQQGEGDATLRRQVAELLERQRDLQEHVATTESQLAALLAQRAATDAVRLAQAHFPDLQLDGSATVSSPRASPVFPRAAGGSPTADLNDIPVHYAFREPAPTRRTAPRAAASTGTASTTATSTPYNHGLPMGGGVGHIRPPPDLTRTTSSVSDPITRGGYGGYIMRGLIHVVTLPVACCLRPPIDEDELDYTHTSTVGTSKSRGTVDAELISRALEAARARDLGIPETQRDHIPVPFPSPPELPSSEVPITTNPNTLAVPTLQQLSHSTTNHETGEPSPSANAEQPSDAQVPRVLETSAKAERIQNEPEPEREPADVTLAPQAVSQDPRPATGTLDAPLQCGEADANDVIHTADTAKEQPPPQP
jgi:hypothetical protein